MLKLKTLVKEIHSEQRPDASLDKYLLENFVVPVSDYLYHGTPYVGLLSMLTEGIWGTEHSEVAEYDAFSTSLSSGMMHHFSEGDGETGLAFKVTNARVIVLDDKMTFLMTQLPGSGMSAEVDDEAEFEEFVKRFQIPVGSWRHGPFLPYNYLSSLGVDAWMYDYVYKTLKRGYGPHHNDESEICFIGKGITKLNNLIHSIWIDGNEYDPEDKAVAIRVLKEKIDDEEA